MAAPITIPNGDFSNAANNGHIGGGLIGGFGSGVIGSGPWNGTYKGAANLLAPPLLTIGNQEATISGLLGVNVLGIVDNSGYFSQSLTTAYEANEHYVLTADVDASVPLDVGVLNSGNAGIALTQGTTVLAATGTTGTIVSLTLLSGTRYQLTLAYDTGATVTGNIGVRLFAKPQNLVTANLLTAVSFTNVTLSGSEINPVPSSITPGLAPGGGTPQSTTVNMPFATPFTVTVLDADGDPVQGITVTFTAPESGPSVVLSTPLPTDMNGQTHVTGTANGIAGTYVVTATVAGVATPATFELTNTAGGASSAGNATGTPQDATVNTNFTTPLGVTVTDAAGNPLQGITVTFSSPGSGASANFPNGSTAITGPDGIATIDVMANMVAGSYLVTATVVGVTSPVTFALTNDAGPAVSAVATTGTPQSAQVSTAFNVPLSAEIEDAFGNGIPNVSVTFTSDPSSAAGAMLSPTTVTTDANGIATVDAAANATAGTYNVTASSTGLSDATFVLTNTTAMTPVVVTTSGNHQGQNVQAMFSCMLQLKVTTDGTTPVANMAIEFLAPSSGPSSTLSNGTDSGMEVTVLTDSNGLAGVTAMANDTPGTYDITAQTVDGSALASYQLTNFVTGDRIFADGFETTPAICPN